ncbi:hypothetical protein [Myroides phaeus]|uniref:Uncharacterized protein n=1 Tax=Myroides phaeus TaxID=702745 RepID=A0A1G8EBX6_9FLAO|nr:hypothetical protein [Myroides phaeus]SDH67240.1 hypothetical protein SAMN05421818_11021 [Myroides phaeus]
MKNNQIYDKIYEIAKSLSSKSTTFTRSDLSYELKSLGVKNDSFDVNTLVWDTYLHFNKDIRVKKAFVNNEQNNTIIDEHELYIQLQEGDSQAVFAVMQDSIDNIQRSVYLLEQQFGVDINAFVAEKGTAMIARIVGTSGTMKVQQEASALFNNYNIMINNYEESKDSIIELIEDFLVLRENVLAIYREYSQALIDVFGDSIKLIAPELFDFNHIKWLDTKGMLESVSLEYDKLATSCGVLVGEIGEGFKKSLNTAAKYSKVSKNGKVALGLAVVGMLTHYVEAEQKTTMMKQELLKLKGKIKEDVTTVKADMGRLMEIYKTLNELYIPKAQVFYGSSREVLSQELKGLITSIYNTAELQALKAERDQVLKEYNLLGNRILDENRSIEYYKSNIQELKQLLEDGKDEYEMVLQVKPQKPMMLVNALSFGAKNKTYNRELYDWSIKGAPVVSAYEEAKVSLKLDMEELSGQQENFKLDTANYNQLKGKLDRVNRVIADKLEVSDDVKIGVGSQLGPYISLLRIAKDIVNSKLDQRLVNTISINKHEEVKLPAEIEQNVNNFIQGMRQNLVVNDFVSKEVTEEFFDATFMKEEDQKKIDKEKLDENSVYGAQDLKLMINSQNKAVQAGIGYFESWLQLQNEVKLSVEASRYYDQQMEQMEEEFRKNIASIDNKAELLRAIISRINKAGSPETLKEGMLMLAEISGDKLSKNDVIQLLKGDKIIKI